ncbi:MAG: multiple sugar transport system substrate-binding protein [Saprospiraceae bacterium]|jgi:multiple sugar transport system substrate-binding protein
MKKPNCKINFGLLYLSLFGLLLIAGCQQKEKVVEITFGFNFTESENIQPLIDQFNQENQGKIKVNWEETSAVSDEFYQQIEKDLTGETPHLDVFGADVVWTAALASQDLVENLSPRFYQEFNPSDFVAPALRSAIYNFKVWGVPWFTDTGIIFMRKDLLEKNNIMSPPVTWAALKASAKKVMEASGVKYGYVFQGAAYEGGVVNACEFIWNTNGNILIGDLFTPEGSDNIDIPLDIITIDSKESERGFSLARSLIVEGIAPEAVVNYTEQESMEAFENGDAVFMRGWPGNYSAFLKKDTKIKPEQIAVCPIPGIEKGKRSYNCLGGWNLMVNAQSEQRKKDAAWAFIKFMTDSPQQKFRAMNGGNLPTLKSLYEDQELLENVEVIALAKESIQHARSRPISPLYLEISPLISKKFNQVLKGEITPEYAVSLLQMELEGIENKSVTVNEK